MKRLKKYRLKIFGGLLLGMLVILLIPPPDPLFNSPYSTVLTSREGDLLSARIAADEQWRFPAMDSLPPKYVTALLQFEDRYFYRHPGINPVSLVRAAYMNIRAGRVLSGGSTLTMQLARMVRGNQPRTLGNKLIEMVLALRMEVWMSKDEILRHYAAHAPFGGNVVGLEAASWRYFGRSAWKLSWAESATLAVLPNAPGLIFPGSNDGHLTAKRNKLLEQLKEDGIISPMDYRLALEEELPLEPLPLVDLAPHLIERARQEHGGNSIYKSTLNKEIQITVNQLVKNYYDQIKHREIHNMAVLVTHIKTGEVVAYAGNANFQEGRDHGSQVDIITSRRSPGSLLKPVLYALALDRGLLSPHQLLPDVPLFYKGFAPQNFNKKFSGAVHADKALQSSLNVPFVNLLKDYGYENLHSRLRRMGLHSLDQEAGHYGLTLILGGGEVTLWEVNTLYAGMARTLLRYNRSRGKARYFSDEYTPSSYLTGDPRDLSLTDQEEGLVNAGSIFLTFRAMEELTRPGTRSNWKQFSGSRAISWKTGTSYGHKDAWAVGLDSDFVVGVWVGNADGEGRPDLVGSQMAAPLMFDVFLKLSAERDIKVPGMHAPLANMHEEMICVASGYRAGKYCTETRRELLPNPVEQPASCPYHKPLNLDEKGEWQVNSSCYPVYKMKKENWFVLPASQAWYYRKANLAYRQPPDFLAECYSDNEHIMQMIYPTNRARVYIPVEIDGKPGNVVFQAAHNNRETPIYWHLDDEYLGSTENIHQMGLKPEKGDHVLSLVDQNGYSLEVRFEVLN